MEQKQKQNYKIAVFKLKGHTTWRVNIGSMENIKNVTDIKTIEVNVVSGEIKVT